MNTTTGADDELDLEYTAVEEHGTITVLARVIAQGMHPDPYFRLRLIELADGRRLVHKTVANSGRGDAEERFQAIEDEIRAGVRFRLCYGNAHPVELPVLVGYAVDCAEPYALFEPFRGRPLATGNRGLLTGEQLRAFQVSLFRAVRQVAAADVVHRAVSPTTVRWDGRDVQLVDFTHSVLTGERSFGTAPPPWSAPEARSRQAPVGAAEDVWSAAMVAYMVALRRDLPSRILPSGSDAANAGLGRIADVFAPVPDQRLTALGVLEKLGVPDPVPAPLVDTRFAEGARTFARLRERKRTGEARAPGESAAGPRWDPFEGRRRPDGAESSEARRRNGRRSRPSS